MKRHPFILLTIFMLTICISCDRKDEFEGCLGCVIDISIQQFTFTVEGIMKENCSGDPAANKILDFYIFYELDSLAGTTQTDANGRFSFTYNKVLPGAYWMGSKWSSMLRLLVREDSTIFYLAGLRNLPDLDLTINDSLDMDVIANKGDMEFTSLDTIIYWFGSSRRIEPLSIFKRTGPVADQEVINNIHGKWKYVSIDHDTGTPSMKVFWLIRRSSSFISSNSFTSIASKKSCNIKKDSIVIALP